MSLTNCAPAVPMSPPDHGEAGVILLRHRQFKTREMIAILPPCRDACRTAGLLRRVWTDAFAGHEYGGQRWNTPRIRRRGTGTSFLCILRSCIRAATRAWSGKATDWAYSRVSTERSASNQKNHSDYEWAPPMLPWCPIHYQGCRCAPHR